MNRAAFVGWAFQSMSHGSYRVFSQLGFFPASVLTVFFVNCRSVLFWFTYHMFEYNRSCSITYCYSTWCSAEKAKILKPNDFRVMLYCVVESKCYFFFHRALRSCDGNWVQIRPLRQSHNAMRYKTDPVPSASKRTITGKKNSTVHNSGFVKNNGFTEERT